jgi:hypothetical protein
MPWQEIAAKTNAYIDAVVKSLRKREWTFRDRHRAQAAVAIGIYVNLPIGTEIGFIKVRNASYYESVIDPTTGKGHVFKLGQAVGLTIHSQALLWLINRIARFDNSDYLFVSLRQTPFSGIVSFGLFVKRTLVKAGIHVNLIGVKNAWRQTRMDQGLPILI